MPTWAHQKGDMQRSGARSPLFAYVRRMGDVKLTPRETSRLLTHLDEGVRKVADARDQIIDAMARRTTKPDTERPAGPARRSRKKR